MGWVIDAPVLEDPHWTLLGVVSPEAVEVALSASYRWRPSDVVERLEYVGPASLGPVTLRVKDPDDAEVFLAEVFGDHAVARVERTDGDWQQLGQAFSADRRRWLSVDYRFPSP